MNSLLKYCLSYIFCLLILVASFSKGFLGIDSSSLGSITLFSMVLAIFPILLYIAAIKAKPWLPITLFIIYGVTIFYFYDQTLKTEFSTWFKEEQLRQFTVLAVIVAAAMVFGLRKRFSLTNSSPEKGSNIV